MQTLHKIFWNKDILPIQTTVDSLLTQLRNDDISEGLLYDAPVMDDILSDSEGLNLDGIVVTNVRLKAKMLAMKRVMNQISQTLSIVGEPQISEPFMRLGSAQVAVLFPLSDGQAITVYFHNPDITPKKITPQDPLISFKFLLNKKDITIVVAPERGAEQDVRQIGQRIMRLAEKNSAAFQRQNARSAERKANIERLMAERDRKKAELAKKAQEIAILEAIKAQEETDKAIAEAEQRKQAEKQATKENTALEVDIDNLDTDLTAYQQEGDKNLTKAVQRYITENLQGKYVNTQIGKVYFNAESKQELSFRTGFDDIRAKIIPFVPNTLKDGQYLGREELYKDRTGKAGNFIAFHKFKHTAKLEQKLVEHTVKVGEREDGQYLFIAYHSRYDELEMDSTDTTKGNVLRFTRRRLLPSVDCLSANGINLHLDSADVNNEDGWNIEIISITDLEGNPIDIEDYENRNKIKDEEEPIAEQSEEEPNVIELTGKEFGEFDTSTTEGKKALREKAFEYLVGLAESGEKVFCKALNADVGFTKSGAKKYKKLSGNPIKSLLVAKIKDIIANSIKFKESQQSYDEGEKISQLTYHYLKQSIRVDGSEYGVRIVIRQDPEGQYHYDTQVADSVESILDSTNEKAMKPIEANKSSVFHRSNGQTDLADDNTAILDDVQAENGYVLNLFVFDKDGNEIKDEEEPIAEQSEEEPNVIELTGKEFGEFDTSTTEGKKALREKAFEYLVGLAESGEKVFCKALNADVGFTKSGAKKYKQLSANPVKSKLAIQIKDLIASGSIFKPSEERYDHTEQENKLTYHYLKNIAFVDEQEYGVRMVIREDSNGHFHYDLQINNDGIDAIMDDVEQKSTTLLPVTKRGLYGANGQTDLAENNTTILDNAQAENGYVLNLFVFDADGNPIPDEEEEMVENNEENEMASNSEQEKTVHTEAQIRFLQDVIDGKVDALAQDFHDKFAKVAENVVDTHPELLEQAINAYIKVVDDYAARIEAEEKAAENA